MLKIFEKEIEREWKHQPIHLETVFDFTHRFFSKIGFNFSGKKVLDIGCGWGADTAYLACISGKVTGVDVKQHKTWSNLTEKYPNLDFKTGSACSLPFQDKSFDVVFMKFVLHHLSSGDRQKALGEIKRVVRPKGKIIIVEANKYNPLFYFHFTLLRHHPHFSRGDFKLLIEKKFKKVKIQDFELHNYPLKNNLILSFLHFGERIWEKMPILRYFSSFEVAIIS